MLLIIAAFIGFGIVVGLSVYLVCRRILYSDSSHILAQANAKAKAIELEAQNMLNNEQLKLKEMRMELEQSYKDKAHHLSEEYKHKTRTLECKEQQLKDKINAEQRALKDQKARISHERNDLLLQKDTQLKMQKQYLALIEELNHKLSHYTGLTKQEAKDILLKNLEDELIDEKAHLIRRYEKEAKEQASKAANFILAQATTRYAGEFAAERLINVVTLPDDDMKGRIIGKEGRNIKALEMISGVDVIIDDTPATIILSSFNLYRRAIALKTLNLLIDDGRIHPARIEEVYNRVEQEMEQEIQEEGKSVILDLGLDYMHPEIVKLIGKLRYRASFGQNALGHSIQTANLAGIIAAQLGGDEKLAKRAGLLHDIGKALTIEQGGGDHVMLGADICKRYKEHPVVINAIMSHHGNEPIESVEAAAVCAADTLSAARPGARREVLESFLTRMQDLERIATDKLGVKQAYAINAGRELRVIVQADLVNDSQSIVLAKEIADEIQATLNYPGEVKVSVIREVRAVEFAH
ncbi:ribonuclease Y [Helicobacter sp. CLO-3]|uniref:ribonuclease Y n=1 Tax=unclassified Helicobacter TaxID=2593540 RepID=UPI000805DD16|nr:MULTISPECIES: ribonuclease Y [unclassified Helicobacter]OBV29022.1 ribonuclease Y [Helicobacter sp. CLO-3]OHU81716.1 ribonuclease Y [Helicobacter sp. CLO-3]